MSVLSAYRLFSCHSPLRAMGKQLAMRIYNVNNRSDLKYMGEYMEIISHTHAHTHIYMLCHLIEGI